MVRIKERRRLRRVTAALPIKITYNSETRASKTKNISVLGAYVELDKEIPLGITLDIKIKVPNKASGKTAKSAEVRCTGVVFRSHQVSSEEVKNRYGAGLFFHSFLENGERILSNYINYVIIQEEKIGKIYLQKKRRERTRQKGGK